MPTIPILADNTSGSNVTYWLAVILVAAGLGLIVLVLLGMRRGFGPGAASSESVGMGSIGTEGSGVATTEEAERLLRLMGEAEEVCGRLGRDLDDKAQRLERLLARAEGMLGDSGAGGAGIGQGLPDGYPSRPEIVTRPVGVPTPPQPAAYAGGYQQPHRVSQAAQPSPAQAVFGPQHGLGGVSAGVQPAQAATDPEAMAQQIYRLADAGLTPGEIAQRLGQHTGKVELIIALRNT